MGQTQDGELTNGPGPEAKLLESYMKCEEESTRGRVLCSRTRLQSMSTGRVIHSSSSSCSALYSTYIFVILNRSFKI